MTLSWNAGFKKHDVVEAGLEGKETDTEVRWILSKFKSSKTPKWFVAETETKKGKYIGKVKIGVTPSGEPTYINEGYEKIQAFKTTIINGKTYLVGTYLNK
jgi:hypothetical protein